MTFEKLCEDLAEEYPAVSGALHIAKDYFPVAMHHFLEVHASRTIHPYEFFHSLGVKQQDFLENMLNHTLDVENIFPNNGKLI